MGISRRLACSHCFLTLGAVLIAVAATAMLAARPAGAQVGEAPRFAIIDVQKVLRESVAVRDLNRELEKLRTAYQTELRGKEEDLRGADQELIRQRAILSTQVFAQKRQDLERRVATLQREVQERKRILDRGFSSGLSKVRAELARVAKAIAEEMGLDLILSKATVVIVKPEFEITDEATKRLNRNLPTVSVEIPRQ